jgi:hypothetical protein
MKTHIIASNSCYTKVTAVCLESGTTVKVRYLSDVDDYVHIPLAGKTKIIKANKDETFNEGDLIEIQLGIAKDSRFGNVQVYIGYNKI